jgi:hypothetical protein
MQIFQYMQWLHSKLMVRLSFILASKDKPQQKKKHIKENGNQA